MPVVSNLRMAFALCLILLLISSAAAFMSIQNLYESTDAVKDTHKSIHQMESIIASLRKAESQQREFIITGKPELILSYENAFHEALIKLSFLKQSSPVRFFDAEKYVQLEILLKAKIAQAQLLLAGNKRKRDEGKSLYQKIELMGDTRKIVREMQLFTYDKLAVHATVSNKYSTYAQIVIVFTVTLIIFITFFFYSKLERNKLIKVELDKERELMRKKDEFISIASHELKTPITSMKGYLQIADSILLKEQNLRCHSFVIKANRQADKLNSLIRDLLSVSKINAGNADYRFTAFYISEIIDDVRTFAASLSDKHVIKVEGDTGVEVIADKFQIEQVLGNLISNAIKYSPNFQDILIKIEILPERLKISVIDGGIGIPFESINQIFNRFYRVESGTFTSSGLGIGLYVSKEIIERHNGKLDVESVEGKGSIFSFTIPLKQA